MSPSLSTASSKCYDMSNDGNCLNDFGTVFCIFFISDKAVKRCEWGVKRCLRMIPNMTIKKGMISVPSPNIRGTYIYNKVVPGVGPVTGVNMSKSRSIDT